jgi:lipid-A-disaccharide synthase
MNAAERPEGLTVCLIAAEESGDRLGSALMRTLKNRADSARFIGIGGHEMLEEGLQPLVAINEFASIGIGSIIAHLPAIFRYIKHVATAAAAAHPDVVVIIDSPELTQRMARRIRKQAPSIPIVNYVSPSVWAWRPGRARAMRSFVDHILALLPFEPEVHAQLRGPACSYVGHPLVEQLNALRPNADEADRRRADPPVLVVLPGSRADEIRRMTAVFGGAIAILEGRIGAFDVVVPTVPYLKDAVLAATASWTVRPRVVVTPEEKWAAFRIARVALAKSGTVTLELALSGIPTVAAYKVSLLDEFIARVAVSVPSVILTNLILGENVVPEFLQRDCTAEKLAEATVPLFNDSPERRRQVEAFARLDAIMETGAASPSERAAEIVLSYAKRTRT